MILFYTLLFIAQSFAEPVEGINPQQSILADGGKKVTEMLAVVPNLLKTLLEVPVQTLSIKMRPLQILLPSKSLYANT